jgi:hypothetical protein
LADVATVCSPDAGSLTGCGFVITSSLDDAPVPIIFWNQQMKTDDIKKDFLEPFHPTQNHEPHMPNLKLKCLTDLGNSYRAHPN